MDTAQYAEMWHDPVRLRQHIDEVIKRHPELFPAGISSGYQLTGQLPESKKLPGIRLRQLRVKNPSSSHALRPSLALPYMMGRLTEESVTMENSLLLLSHNVPAFKQLRLLSETSPFKKVKRCEECVFFLA